MQKLSPTFFNLVCCFAVCLANACSLCNAEQPLPNPHNKLAKLAVAKPFVFEQGDRIAVVGNSFGEAIGEFGYFEAILNSAYPDKKITLRNLSWSGDEVTRVSGKLLQPRPLNFGDVYQHLAMQKPTVIMLCFGMGESFRGKDAVETFERDLTLFVEELKQKKWNGQVTPRLIVVSPIAHENLGGHLPNPVEHDRALILYTDVMRRVCKEKKLRFIDLFSPTNRVRSGKGLVENSLTRNGIHVNERGAKVTAKMMAGQLGIPSATLTKITSSDNKQYEQLRSLVIQKNKKFFERFRAINGEYIYGRRKKPFGVVNFPTEMKELDAMVSELDRKIHALASQK